MINQHTLQLLAVMLKGQFGLLFVSLWWFPVAVFVWVFSASYYHCH
jgi:hypothetical protein